MFKITTYTNSQTFSVHLTNVGHCREAAGGVVKAVHIDESTVLAKLLRRHTGLLVPITTNTQTVLAGDGYLHLHLRVMGEIKPGGLFEYPYQSSGSLKEF
jgi:hypothetical protein